MVVHRADPLNCETSLPGLIGGVVTASAATCRRPLPRSGRRRARRAASRARYGGGIRDWELAIGSLEEQIGVTARKEPRGRDRARADAKVASSRVRIHASPRGVRTGVNDLAQRLECREAVLQADPDPPAKAAAMPGP